ncbi:hypothetical protein CFC21_003701 [Triticum aestivum]|uniref:Uncharacterized protein n=1 Tax=Triticum aestivum TaxID=4565 RepID=A0A3B5Y5I3_WHEAT|nr:hypothetical protein CFC21_003701 [Triticum aestivum]
MGSSSSSFISDSLELYFGELGGWPVPLQHGPRPRSQRDAATIGKYNSHKKPQSLQWRATDNGGIVSRRLGRTEKVSGRVLESCRATLNSPGMQSVGLSAGGRSKLLGCRIDVDAWR